MTRLDDRDLHLVGAGPGPGPYSWPCREDPDLWFSIQPEEVDYINAHGTATGANDIVETRAIKRFFGRHSRKLSISATKPVTGHLMGGAGAIETVICALAIHHAAIPMTANLVDADPECDLDYVAARSRPYPLNVVLNLNSGFGGKNSCMVLRRYNPKR